MSYHVLGAQLSWPGNFSWLWGTGAPFSGAVSSATVGLGSNSLGRPVRKTQGWKEMLLMTQ